jgi:predicted Fe-S protein YdhL (DUF1289 family)
MIPDPQTPILSPCIGVCELRADGLCEGCPRTGAEIALWRSMSDGERRFMMEHTLPAREAACR